MLEVPQTKQKGERAGSLGAAFEGKSESARNGASQFQIPRLELPKMEIPAAFREIAEKGLSQAKESYDRLRSVSDEATEVIEDTYVRASKGAAEYGLKLIEATRINTNAALDLAADLLGAKTLSEAIELSSEHGRKQFEVLAAQTKELTTLAQRLATESSEPIRSGVDRALSKAR